MPPNFTIMKFKLVLLLLILSTHTVFGQINMSDSTVQVIGYWNLGDQETYEVSYEKYTIKEQDTTSRSMINYEIEITIKDSTAHSFTIEWLYKNYKTDTENKLAQKISKAAEDISVIIKTDEFGAVEEVLNWKEVRDYMRKVMKPLKKELQKLPGAEEIINQSLATYSTKESIESNAIKDAIQFYTFHGGLYTLNEELTGQMQFANNYGTDPFDVKVILSLDEINEENDNSVIRMTQTVDSDQLTKVTYEYLKSIGTFGDKMPDIKDLPALTNTIWTASRIHGTTGWVTYSVETKEVTSDKTVNIEERIIQIK
jgi:hypothetical protein